MRDSVAKQVNVAVSAAEMLRQTLGLQDEEDDDEEASAKKSSKRRRAPPMSVEEVSVTLGDCNVKVRVHERPFEIEATPEAVMAVVRFCQERLKDDPITLKRDQRREALAEEASAKKASAQEDSASATASASASASASAPAAANSFCLGAVACPAVLGKVTWHPSVKAWAVHIKDGQKKTQTKRVPVRPPKDSGAFLEDASADRRGDSWAAARRAAYEEALRMWNKLDCSTRERIKLPEVVVVEPEDVSHL